MKTTLWMNPITTGAALLDPISDPQNVEQLVIANQYKRKGREVILLNPFARDGSTSYTPTITYTDLPQIKADEVVMSIAPGFADDYMHHKYWGEIEGKPTNRARVLDACTDYLEKFDGPISIFVGDPRPPYQKGLFHNPKRRWHPFRKFLESAKLIVADPLLLREELRDRAVVNDYWKHVDVGPMSPYNSENEFFCVYPGVKVNNTKRKNLVKTWIGETEGCYTIGQIDIKGIPSLSNYQKVPLSEVCDITRRSTTALVCGEPTHTWLTPRVIQSLCQGTICSIHPDFAGRHHFPDEILQDQTFETAADFDYGLLKPEIYERQLNFVRELRSCTSPPS